MKKRQVKKNAKRHVHLIGDEFNLMLMNDEERATALRESAEYRLKLAKKPYRQLKSLGVQPYYYRAPKKPDFVQNYVGTIGGGRGYTAMEYTQTLEGLDEELVEKLKKMYT